MRHLAAIISWKKKREVVIIQPTNAPAYKGMVIDHL